jgi:hypothetical protein
MVLGWAGLQVVAEKLRFETGGEGTTFSRAVMSFETVFSRGAVRRASLAGVIDFYPPHLKAGDVRDHQRYDRDSQNRDGLRNRIGD